MLTEFKQTLRSLTKRPGFFASAVILIAIGIAASTTAFTLIHTLFYKPRAGIVDAASLYNVHREANTAGPSVGDWTYPDYLQMAAESRQFANLSVFTGFEAGFAHGASSDRVMAQLVSANFFSLLGAHAQLGRFFLPEEDREVGRHPVVIISDRLWHEQFAADPAVLGRNVKVNGETMTVVGVAEAGFHGTFIGFDFDLWLPMGIARVIGSEADLASINSAWVEMIGRLAPGATATTAQAELDRIAQRLHEGRSEMFRNFHVKLTPNRPIDDDLRGTALGFVGALSCIAGLVLVIACLNVSSLLLTRAEERRRESAVRLALGCGQRRLIGEWLRESLVIFLAGGTVGLLLSKWIADLALFRQPSTAIPLSFDFQLDWRAFAFSFGVSLVAGLLTGLLPALRAARADLVNDLKAGDSRGSTGSARVRHALVVAQLAFSIVPLVVTGLFIRTLEKNSHIRPGFEPAGLYVADLNLSLLGGDTSKRGADAGRRLLERARNFPGVTHAVLASRVPLGLGSLRTGLSVVHGPNEQPKEGFDQALTFAGAGYFEAMKIPLVSGREFNAADEQRGAPPVVIINETTARKLFGDSEPLNREVLRGKTTLRIVGVAREVKYSKLWEEPTQQAYLSMGENLRPRLRLVVRLSGGSPADLQRALQTVEPELPIAPLSSATELIDFTLFPQRLGAQIAAVLGGICLLLAAIGLYSVLALGAVRQMREFGVRIALGAQSAQIASLVFRRVAILVSCGLLAGGGLAYAASQLVTSFVHGVDVIDPLTYATVAGALGVIALLAAWLPARRAMHADPMVALRSE